MWPALFSVDPIAIYTQPMTHHISTGHTAGGVLTACQSRIGVGVDLYAGLEFWTFFQPQSQGVDLYEDCLILGNIR